jgi:hypothetical protein
MSDTTIVTFTEVDYDDDYPSVTDDLTEARLAAFATAREELENWVASKIAPICQRRWPKHRAWLKDFNSYQVELEYNDACRCHPSYAVFTFPLSWLFAENWRALVDIELTKEQQAQQAKDAANNAIREKQEREELARLQAKFNTQAETKGN